MVIISVPDKAQNIYVVLTLKTQRLQCRRILPSQLHKLTGVADAGVGSVADMRQVEDYVRSQLY